MTIQIRRALPSEAAELTLLAHAAKRHWGYSEEWMKAWQTQLTLTPEFISGNEVFVAVIDEHVAGCCALVVSEEIAELEHMWIDPQHLRKGVGRGLFEHVARRAAQLGFNALELSADPNAQQFYERMGAKRIGDVPADVAGQPRVLPRMRAALI